MTVFRDDIPRAHGDGTGGAARAGRSYVSVLFSDLCGSTALSDAMEAEDYAEVLARLRTIYDEVIAHHGGTVVRIQGDGVLAIFGYPTTDERDGRRATEAALELHEQVRAIDPSTLPARAPSLRLHSGIDRGWVLVQQGDMVLGLVELLGAVPITAARLSDLAGKDEVLVSDVTLGPARHFFETSPRRELSIPGRVETTAAFSVFGRASIGTLFEARAQRGLSPFVGRQPELAALRRHLDAAMAGHGRQVALVAPAGVGKTRLTQEFLRVAAHRGCHVLRGYCESHLSAEPLQPILQMLRAMFGLSHATTDVDAVAAIDRRLAALSLQALLPDLAGALSVQIAPSPGAPGAPSLPVPAARRPGAASTAIALKALMARLAENEPLVMCIDDWQWADAATRQAIAALRALDSSRLLVLLATRPVDAGDAAMSALDAIELPPFSQTEAARAIIDLLPRADPFVMAEIARYAGGNPLFIEELCHSAAHEGIDQRLVRKHGSASWLSGLVQSRVARLPAVQAELVRTCAVIGNVIPAWLLRQLTGFDIDHPLVLDLAEQDFIFAGEAPGTLRFKHGITRDVVYESVGLHPRRALHLRIAEAVREGSAGSLDDVAETLAYHYLAGGRPLEAAGHAAFAGDKALAVSALDRAKAQYHAALDSLDLAGQSWTDPARWIAIANKLGMVCVFDAARPDLEVFKRAVALAQSQDDREAQARARYWLGYIHYALGESRQAIRQCEAAHEAALQAGHDPLAVQIRATLGQAHTAACDYDRALPLLDEAIAIKRSHRQSPRQSERVAVGLAYALVCRAWVVGDRGNFPEAYACLDEALALVDNRTHEIGASIQGWRAAILLWQGDWTAASVAAAQSTDIAERTRSLFQFCIGRAMQSYADWMLTERPSALQAVRQATDWIEPRDGTLFRSLNHGWLADGLVTAGQHAAARSSAARSVACGRQGDLLGVAMAQRAMAREAALRRDRKDAERRIARALRVAQARQSAHETATTQMCAAEIALAFEDRKLALAMLDRALPAFERMGMKWHAARAARLMGE